MTDSVKEQMGDLVTRAKRRVGVEQPSAAADDANAVVVIGRYEGDGVEGDRLDEPAIQVWEFQGNAVARVRIFTDSAGFPSVITERREQEMEEEEREKKEREEKEDQEREEAKASSEKKDDDGEKNEEEREGSSDDDG